MHALRPYALLVVVLTGCSGLLGLEESDPGAGAPSSGDSPTYDDVDATQGSSSGRTSSGDARTEDADASASSGAFGGSSGASDASASSSGADPAAPPRSVDLAYPAWLLPPSRPLPANYDVRDGLVYDRTTGLTWERAPTLPSSHYAEAAAYCDTLSLAGITDWRLPSRSDLISLLDLGVTGGAWIEAAAFPGTLSVDYWSGSLHEGSTLAPQRWTVDFGSGGTGYDYEDGGTHETRCVRGTVAALTLPPHFEASAETVHDLATGLIWQRRAYDAYMVTQADAVLACSDLVLEGLSGFRLPTLRELYSIVDEHAVQANAIDERFFQRGLFEHWTSTTNPGQLAEAMVVAFSMAPGVAYPLPRTETLRFRCVK